MHTASDVFHGAPSDISSSIDYLDAFHTDTSTEPQVRLALTHVASMQSWLDHHKVQLTRQLLALASTTPSIVPQQVLASIGNITRTEAFREVNRANTLRQFPTLEQAFVDGRISSAHIDAITRVAFHLDDSARQQLTDRGAWINTIATHATPDNFARALKSEVARIHNDDGVSVLERQRTDITLKHWVDRESGMFCVNGRLDPESGLRFIGRLDNTVEQLFHAAVPTNCPTDDRKHGHLAALALVALVDGSALSSSSPNSRAEVSVVIDLHTLTHGLHDKSVIHTGHDVELPIETIRRMACEAEIIPIVLDSKGVVLDIGRASRLATRYQRKALEVMYPTCAIEYCNIPNAQCQPHHIRYWRDDGTTDMHNLIPLCPEHHRCVHEGGWKLSLHGESRQLCVTYPDGRSLTSSPTDTARKDLLYDIS